MVSRRIAPISTSFPQFRQGGTTAAKPRVFVGYHHSRDQYYHDRFVALFAGSYDIIVDRSLGEAIDSDNDEYIKRRIREVFITGSSTTIVLCGQETWKRKHVDWEIYATLDKRHALVGLLLPTHIMSSDGTYRAPDRLVDNHRNGYVVWGAWTESAQILSGYISAARSKPANLIDNSRLQMARNLS